LLDHSPSLFFIKFRQPTFSRQCMHTNRLIKVIKSRSITMGRVRQSTSTPTRRKSVLSRFPCCETSGNFAQMMDYIVHILTISHFHLKSFLSFFCEIVFHPSSGREFPLVSRITRAQSPEALEIRAQVSMDFRFFFYFSHHSPLLLRRHSSLRTS
jgi:hypothetical protein